MRKRVGVLLGSIGSALIVPDIALAHGLGGRADLPIPQWLFGWAAAVVLVVSFVALAALWSSPKLEQTDWRPLPRSLGRLLASPPAELLAGGIGVLCLGFLLWAGLAGTQNVVENASPTFVYVIFWLGFLPASVLFGDVFRAFNPWRAVGRAVGWLARTATGGDLPAPQAYPTWLGHWPAAAGLVAFTWMELAASGGALPRNLAIATLIYSAFTFLAMLVFGVESWTERGEAFSVYFGLFARLSVFERRDDEVGLRRPLSGLSGFKPMPGTVALLAVMIGTVTFDGLQEGAFWAGILPDIWGFFTDIGIGSVTASELAAGVGIAGSVAAIFTFYGLGIAGARRVGRTRPRLAGAFVHSLVPIALAYLFSHYLTLLLFQGQAIAALASDPLGKGWNLFGTADWGVDYGFIGASTTWYLQVAFVVGGHVLALSLAHDRALTLYPSGTVAVRSQYWMLAVMVGFTSLALWLLSQANA